jgi:hypothetical protein
MNVVSVSWMAEALVPNSAAMVGNAGRYMSIDSGATAVNNASTPSQLSGIAESVRVAFMGKPHIPIEIYIRSDVL